KKKWRKWIT
ncbi:MAG: hypothetical protein KJZ55_10700, partial [Flavobacteriales bacterium]|nr:hypothetical protein [Flavobacteriales bacterium]